MEQSAGIQMPEAHSGADGVKARVINLGPAGMAHDLNNLLTPVIWMLDSLRAMHAGIPVQYQRIEGAIAFGPRIRLVFNMPSALPAIGGDRERVERALLNLIINAREAMADGGTVTIGVHTEFRCAATLGQAEIGLHISICDTGAGMDAATLHGTAEPFFSTKPNGYGLGLAVTCDLIEQLGGDMTIASLPGIGKTIDIWLPAARRAIDPSPNDPSDQMVKGAILSHQA